MYLFACLFIYLFIVLLFLVMCQLKVLLKYCMQNTAHHYHKTLLIMNV